MNNDNYIIARNVKMLMDYYNNTQQDLHKKSGVSQKTISNILNATDDKFPNLNIISQIASAYNLQTYQLLIPHQTIEDLTEKKIERVLKNYFKTNKLGRDNILRICETEARYSTLIENNS